MTNDNVLVESKRAREKMLANERSLQVLDKVKELTYLKDDTYVTINQVVSYYEVSKRTIERLIYESREEFEFDGMMVIEGKELKEFKVNKLKKQGLYQKYKYSKKLTLLPKKILLKIGLLLTDSVVAQRLEEEIIKSKDYNLIEFMVLSNKRKVKENRLKYQLLQAFNGVCSFETQVKCGSYFIDFVLNGNIAVECDENGHEDRKPGYELKREKFIKNEGYKLIRYNPDSEDTVFDLINRVMRELI